MSTNLQPKRYSGVPAGTPIITDLNQAPDQSYLYQIASGHAMHHDPESGATQYYDHQGQPTNQLAFLDAHSKATSYGDPNAYTTHNTSLASASPQSSLTDSLAQSAEITARLSNTLARLDRSTPEGSRAFNAIQEQLKQEERKRDYLSRIQADMQKAQESANKTMLPMS